jgi:hypothetical protein
MENPNFGSECADSCVGGHKIKTQSSLNFLLLGVANMLKIIVVVSVVVIVVVNIVIIIIITTSTTII